HREAHVATSTSDRKGAFPPAERGRAAGHSAKNKRSRLRSFHGRRHTSQLHRSSGASRSYGRNVHLEANNEFLAVHIRAFHMTAMDLVVFAPLLGFFLYLFLAATEPQRAVKRFDADNVVGIVCRGCCRVLILFEEACEAGCDL